MKKAISLIISLLLLPSIILPLNAKNESFMVYNADPAVSNTGAADFSYLNEMPAGQHGALLSKGDDFVFEDGTPVKFFGVNIGFGAAFPEKSVAESMASNLAALGANMVRIHATDMTYASFIDYTADNTQTYNADMLDRLDYLVYCLKEKGIYIHLDMAAGRIFYEGDGFSAEEAAEMKKGVLRGYLFYNDTAAQLIRQYITFVLNHENPYTKMKYANDPAIAIIQYSNETSITWVDLWQNSSMLQDSLREKWQDYLINKYKTDEALRAAWTNSSGKSALRSTESLTKRNVTLLQLESWQERCAMIGISQPLATQNIRQADMSAFFIKVETEAFNAAYKAARDTGYKGRINCSNYSTGCVDTYINTFGDLCERTCYLGAGTYTPAYFPQEFLVSIDPTLTDGHFISKAQKGVAADKPFLVSEYNVLTPIEYHSDTLLQAACYGALQDWDGLMLFCYTFDGYFASSYFGNKGLDNFYGMYNDPAATACFGIASAIFRGGLVSEAKNSVEVAFTDDDVLLNNENYNALACAGMFVSRFSNAFIGSEYSGNADLVFTSGNTASGKYDAAKKLFIHSESIHGDAYQKSDNREEWLSSYLPESKSFFSDGFFSVAVGSDVITDTTDFSKGLLSPARGSSTVCFAMQNLGIIESGQGIHSDRLVSDTSEIILKKDSKWYVKAPRVSIFSGKTDGKINAEDFNLVTTNDMAAVALFSYDQSGDRQLLYNLGRSKNSNTEWDGSMITNMGTAPILAEDIRGTITLYSSRDSLTVYGLDEHGNRAATLNCKKTSDGFSFEMGGYLQYELVYSGNRPQNEVSSLKIVSLPLKTEYTKNEPFDAAGLSVEAVYADGTSRLTEFYSVTGFDPNKTGKQTLQISYGGKTASFETTTKASATADADGDGAVSISDAMLAFYHVAAKSVLSGSAYNACDMNNDGIVSLTDAMKVFMIVSGKA